MRLSLLTHQPKRYNTKDSHNNGKLHALIYVSSGFKPFSIIFTISHIVNRRSAELHKQKRVLNLEALHHFLTSCNSTRFLRSKSKCGAILQATCFFFFTLDFDECQSNQTNSCSQLCINAPGSYSCACQNGYSLNDNKGSCDGTYGNSHQHHRSLVIVDNSLVVNYHFVLRIVKPMALVVHHLFTINRSCVHKVLMFCLRSEGYTL